MLLPPFATPEDFKGAARPTTTHAETHWFIFSGNQLLVSNDHKSLPTHHDFVLQRTLYIGTLKDTHLFTGEVEVESTPPLGWLWSPLRSLYATLDEKHYAIAGRAMQLIDWDRSNQYCGHCGHHTFSREHEHCRECGSCGQLAYPKISPAVLALVKKGNQILLARGAKFVERFYSILAGFVEPGETLEQCVIRETREECGIKVKNVHYFGSQPWPFAHTLMIGFFCEWQEGEIQIDPCEIEEAAWFDVYDLPQLPAQYSLARILIDEFIKELKNQ
jgi:NAD+ diphosphatase